MEETFSEKSDTGERNGDVTYDLYPLATSIALGIRETFPVNFKINTGTNSYLIGFTARTLLSLIHSMPLTINYLLNIHYIIL